MFPAGLASRAQMPLLGEARVVLCLLSGDCKGATAGPGHCTALQEAGSMGPASWPGSRCSCEGPEPDGGPAGGAG